jgi:hypothetical protein
LSEASLEQEQQRDHNRQEGQHDLKVEIFTQVVNRWHRTHVALPAVSDSDIGIGLSEATAK